MASKGPKAIKVGDKRVLLSMIAGYYVYYAGGAMYPRVCILLKSGEELDFQLYDVYEGPTAGQIMRRFIRFMDKYTNVVDVATIGEENGQAHHGGSGK